jgi:hypothetical protein
MKPLIVLTNVLTINVKTPINIELKRVLWVVPHRLESLI